MIPAEPEKSLEKELYRIFDLIAGTATGGIIALAVGTRSKVGVAHHAGQLADIRVDKGPEIFPRGFLTCLRQLIRPKYSPAPLESVLKKFFGDTPFSAPQPKAGLLSRRHKESAARRKFESPIKGRGCPRPNPAPQKSFMLI